MTHWDDSLGDVMKSFERVETDRAAAPGEIVIVRIDGASFSRFTSHLEKPFDERLHRAMIEASRKVVEDFKCRIGYTQSDEATFVLWEPEGTLPFGGKFQKIATRFATKFATAFLLQALKLFPEAVEEQVPEFDGRSHSLPTPEYGAKNVFWRETDARKNAVSMLAQAEFSQSVLQGRSSQEMKEMLAGKGIDFHAQPEAFRRGTFLRRMVVERELEPERLARIPEDRRPKGPVRRSVVAEVPLPHLTFVENLTEVIILGEEPIVRPFEGFVAAVTP
jgi:tRNA(His) 5'-end guanylyltransferase